MNATYSFQIFTVRVHMHAHIITYIYIHNIIVNCVHESKSDPGPNVKGFEIFFYYFVFHFWKETFIQNYYYYVRKVVYYTRRASVVQLNIWKERGQVETSVG